MTQRMVAGANPVGLAVTEQLRERGANVTAVTRHDPDFLPEGAENRPADVLYPDHAVTTFTDAGVVCRCAKPPYGQWPELLPDLTRDIVAGVEAANARFVVTENLYMYGPVQACLSEDPPYAATGPEGQTRAEYADIALDAHKADRIEAIIGRAGSSFGSRVHESIVGGQVFGAAVAGKYAKVLGDPRLIHTYTYVPDFARALVLPGERDEALDEVWHVPNPKIASTRRFINPIYEAADVDPGFPHIIATPGVTLTLGGYLSAPPNYLNAPSRVLTRMRYAFEEPCVIRDVRFRETFGDAVRPTPLEGTIAEMVTWSEPQYGADETELVYIEATPEGATGST